MSAGDDGGADAFEEERPRLLGLAYRMLGSLADAEDVVQDAWLRWDAADRDALRNAEAWLVTVTTRLAMDRLRSAQRSRETYFGPWLPEPLLAGADEDPADVVAEAEQLSLALLTTLERLNPVEQADEYNKLFGELVALEQHRRVLRERAIGDL